MTHQSLTQIPQGSSDFLLEVAKGTLPGHTSLSIGGESPFMTNAGFVDIWDFDTDLVYQTSAESLEVVSDDPNDTLLGTGANKIILECMDDDYVLQETAEIELDGTTPVEIPDTHLRTRMIYVTAAGSSGWNEGNITVQQAGGGLPRLRIRPTLNNSFSSHATVPADHYGIVIVTSQAVPRNNSIRIRPRFRPENGVFQSATLRHMYQNSFSGLLLASPLLPEKTDIKFTGKGFFPNSDVSISYQIVSINKDYISELDHDGLGSPALTRSGAIGGSI